MKSELMKKILFASLWTVLLCFGQPASDPRIASILAELASVRPFEQVAISPEGERVAWVEKVVENGRDTGNSVIYVKDLANGSAPVRLSLKPAVSDSNLAWSPDGSRIAFLSDRARKKQSQLYVAQAAGGAVRKL